jgi:hypothetical protein
LFDEHEITATATRRQRSGDGLCIGDAKMSAPGSTHDQKIDNRPRIRDRRQYSEMKDRECVSFVRHFWAPSTRASTKNASFINGASSADFVSFADAGYEAIRTFRAPSVR